MCYSKCASEGFMSKMLGKITVKNLDFLLISKSTGDFEISIFTFKKSAPLFKLINSTKGALLLRLAEKIREIVTGDYRNLSGSTTFSKSTTIFLGL